MVIAVDFDGTLVNHGVANNELIDWLIEEQKNGSKVGLWTCRKGMDKARAIIFCKKYGLDFDFISEDKVFADCYLDSNAKRPEEIIGQNHTKSNGRQRMTRLGEQRGS